jgi:hypothetical protein
MRTAKTMTAQARVRRASMALWALMVISGSLMDGIVRLTMRAARAIEAGLTPGQWTASLVIVAALVYVEGYRALQCRFVPMVVSRALCLMEREATARTILEAPLFVLCLVGADRIALFRAWLGLASIAGAVLIVRAFPDPWRGIVDAGVAAALTWGLVALWRQFAVTIRSS